jgi:hypothetical protein
MHAQSGSAATPTIHASIVALDLADDLPRESRKMMERKGQPKLVLQTWRPFNNVLAFPLPCFSRLKE